MGFVLFSGWIVYREKAWLPSVIWVILMMVLGFWAGALYLFGATKQRWQLAALLDGQAQRLTQFVILNLPDCAGVLIPVHVEASTGHKSQV